VIVGGGYDRSASDFRQSYQLGGFNADRSAAPTGAETEIVNLEGGSATASLFATDTRSPSPRWHFTGSARYNVTRVRTVDLLSPPLPPPAAGLGSESELREIESRGGCVVYARGRARLLRRLQPGQPPAFAASSWAARTRAVPATCRTP